MHGHRSGSIPREYRGIPAGICTKPDISTWELREREQIRGNPVITKRRLSVSQDSFLQLQQCVTFITFTLNFLFVLQACPGTSYDFFWLKVIAFTL